MTEKLISIIIPCLNSEKMFETAFLSLKNQTFFDKLEIIVVDGGSADNTLNILKEHENKGELKVLHAKERGVPGQIYDGVMGSSCKYIGTIDSDDFVDPRMYEILYNNLINNNCDVSVCNVEPSSSIDYEAFKNKNIHNYDKQQITISPKDPYYTCRSVRYNKIYKRVILLEAVKIYNSNINHMPWDDTVFAFLIYSITSKIVHTNLIMYHYCLFPNSYSRNYKYVVDKIPELDKLCDVYSNIYSLYKNPLYNRLLVNPFYNLYLTCLTIRYKKIFYVNRKKDYKKILNSKAMKIVFENCKFDDECKPIMNKSGVSYNDFLKIIKVMKEKKYLKLDKILLSHLFKKVLYKLKKK